MALKRWPFKFNLTHSPTPLTFGILLLGLFSSLPPLQAQTLFPPAHEQASVVPQTPLEVVILRRAIIGQESGANFRAVNPHSGALGYGQVMPENIPSWSREALGYSISAQQFLANPQVQLYIIDHKLNQYWQKALVASGGNPAIAIQRVAAQWYSGRPELYASTRPQYYAGYSYPSIAEYSYSVLRRYYGLQQAVLAQATSAAAQAIVAPAPAPSPPANPPQSLTNPPSSIFSWTNLQLSENPMRLENEYAQAPDFTL